MSFFSKVNEKMKDGTFKEMWKECLWIYAYVRSYWGAIIFYICVGLLSTGIGLVGSLYLKDLINAVTQHDMTNIKFILIVIVLTGLGGICLNAVTGRISAKINIKVNNEIQADVFSRMLRTEWEEVSEYHSGDLLNRVNADVGNVSGSVIGWVPNLVTRLFQFVAVLCIILYYDPMMALIALICSPVTVLFSRFLIRKMREYNKEMRAVSSEMMAQNEEALQNMQTVKAFNIIDLTVDKLLNVQQKYMWVALDYNKFSVITSAIMSLAGLLTSYACFGWAVYRLWTGYIDIGILVLFLQMASMLSGSFSSLVGMVPSAITSATSAGRIMSIINLPAENMDDRKIIESMGKRITVSLDDVSFGYAGDEEILHDVNLLAQPGRTIALVGPSGEGKTTMIRILLSIVSVTGGKATVSDENGITADITAASRKLFSYVPQGNTMFSGTIADNMRMLKKDATDEEIVEALKTACAWEFVEKLPEGIHHVIGERGGGFSEGQSQRLAIARAILRDAPVLLLDEATSALDMATEKRLLSNIRERIKECTCILTTHRLSVLDMCDSVYDVENKTVTIRRNQI